MYASIVHVTPKDKPDYFIVTMPGRGDLCRHDIETAEEAIAYKRHLDARANMPMFAGEADTIRSTWRDFPKARTA